MNLKLLQSHLDEFRRYLETATDFPLLHLWESQRVFQETWDIGSADFAAMYEASLQNHSIWTLFVQTYPDFARDMFRDLFDENREVEGRMDRFLYHCDELLRDYRENHPDCVETRHYHEDYRMVSLYLAFRYPDRYAIYDHDAFLRFLKKVQAKDIPLVADPGRYFKVVRTVFNFLQKDETILRLHNNRLEQGMHYLGKSMLLGYEAINFEF